MCRRRSCISRSRRTTRRSRTSGRRTDAQCTEKLNELQATYDQLKREYTSKKEYQDALQNGELIHQLQEEVGDLQRDIQILDIENEVLESKLENYPQRVEHARSENAVIGKQRKGLKAELIEMEAECRRLQDQLKRSREK